MKPKALLALTLASLGTLVLAASAQETTNGPSVFLLKSHGKKIAELRLEPGTTCSVQGRYSVSQVEHYPAANVLRATNGVVLKIHSGTNSITVTADEIEGHPAGK